jgi:hypothetical protein
MAKKIASRLELRRQAEAAEAAEAKGKKEKPAKGEKAAKAEKAPKSAKKTAVKKPRAKKKATAPTRLRLVWGVYDNSNNQVAIYPFNERDAAQKRADELTARGKGGYFTQPVKQPIAEEEEEEPETAD